MSLGDDLAFLGIVFGLGGIGVTILFPTQRRIGYLSFVLAGITAICWAALAYSAKQENAVSTNPTPQENTRPWVGVVAAKISPKFPQREFEWAFEIVNTGKSPALKVRIGTATVSGGAPSLYRELAALSPKAYDLPYLSLLPNASTEFHGKGKLTAEQVRLIGDPDMLFRAIGRIDYEDDRNKDYTTTFCYVRRTDGILTTCDELNDMK